MPSQTWQTGDKSILHNIPIKKRCTSQKAGTPPIKKVMKKGISTRLRNLMNNYIGRTFNIVYCGRIIWTSKIVGLMGDTGYFITEINDGQKSWQSNASYGEITNGIKKGQYVEI